MVAHPPITTMLTFTSFVFLVSSLVGSTAQLQCSNVSNMVVDDTAEIGDEIHDFGTPFQLSPGCAHFGVNGTKLVLNHGLRNPCTGANTLSCSIVCQPIGSKVFIVGINKVDIHWPSFPQPQYQANVTELVAVGTEILKFDASDDTRATDEDCGTTMNYFILESDGGNFAMSFGAVVTDGTILYDDKQRYTLIVQAEDSSGKRGNATLIIDVLDSDNKNPAFTDTIYRLNVTEESMAPGPLTTSPPVRCFDQDTGINTTVKYAFKDMSAGSSYFTIDSVTGQLHQTAIMDRETLPSLLTEIMCYQADDVTKTAAAYIEVTVLDANDHPPVFEPRYLNMSVSVVEHSVGVLTSVRATDKDEGDNAVIYYNIVQGGDVFEIDRNSGVISVRAPDLLDRETTANITILVRAEDRDGNFSAENASVLVTLLDLNDNSPEFERDPYVFRFNVTDHGGVIGTVIARDADVPATPNSNVTYETLQTWSVGPASPGPFPLTLGSVSGNITITDIVAADVEYYMFIQACDNPDYENEKRCNSVQVLAVYGLNATSSVNMTYNMTVHENVPLKTVVDRLPLTGSKYDITTTEFEIDSESHMLSTNALLDRETQDTYEFTVLVFSHTELQVGNITVRVIVLDVNDHQPVFSQQEYLFTLPQQGPGHGVIIGAVESEDDDIGDNSNRTYSLQTSPVSSWFTMDGQSGNLTLSDGGWAAGGFKESLFVLVARVADHGTPSLQSTAQIFISTMEMLDNSSVRIHADASVAFIEEHIEQLQSGIAALLGFSRVTLDEVSESSSKLRDSRTSQSRTSMRLRATYENGTTVPSTILARSVLEQWYSVQDLFRSPLTIDVIEHTDTTLRVAEIALIVVAAAILLGALIAIPIVCRQWKSYIRDHRLYDTLRRPSNLYHSQELQLNFTAENTPRTPRSQFSSFRTTPRGKEEDSILDTSFGVAYVSPVFVDDDGNAPKTPTWGTYVQPRIPRWSTSDSLKDAMASLEDLSNRLNAEDSISGVTEISRTRSMKSQNSFKDSGSERLRDWDTADVGETVITAEIEDIPDPEPDYANIAVPEPEPDYANTDMSVPHPDYALDGTGGEDTEAFERDRILMQNGDMQHVGSTEKLVERQAAIARSPSDAIEESTRF